MSNLFLLLRYQIMMNCWQSEPETRPSFAHLTQELKRMENQHKVRFKDNSGSNAVAQVRCIL